MHENTFDVENCGHGTRLRPFRDSWDTLVTLSGFSEEMMWVGPVPGSAAKLREASEKLREPQSSIREASEKLREASEKLREASKSLNKASKKLREA